MQKKTDTYKTRIAVIWQTQEANIAQQCCHQQTSKHSGLIFQWLSQTCRDYWRVELEITLGNKILAHEWFIVFLM
jgi:hypothetical protein